MLKNIQLECFRCNRVSSFSQTENSWAQFTFLIFCKDCFKTQFCFHSRLNCEITAWRSSGYIMRFTHNIDCQASISHITCRYLARFFFRKEETRKRRNTFQKKKRSKRRNTFQRRNTHKRRNSFQKGFLLIKTEILFEPWQKIKITFKTLFRKKQLIWPYAAIMTNGGHINNGVDFSERLNFKKNWPK